MLSLLHGENLLENIKGRNEEEEEHSCVAHACNPNIWEAEAGRLLRLQDETLSQKKKSSSQSPPIKFRIPPLASALGPQ